MFFPTKNGSTHLWISLGKAGFVSRSNPIKPLFNRSLRAEPSRLFPRMHFETSRAATSFRGKSSRPEPRGIFKEAATFQLEARAGFRPEASFGTLPSTRTAPFETVVRPPAVAWKRPCCVRQPFEKNLAAKKKRSCCWPQLFEKIV